MMLEKLNPEQRAAVTLEPQHALVLAGAGSGKTRVLTTRIDVYKRQILGLASQIDRPPNSARLSTYLPSPMTGLMKSVSFMPCSLHEMKSSIP